MKDISFNEEMLEAVLSGRKTVTRRPIKPQPVIAHETLPGSYFFEPKLGAFKYLSEENEDEYISMNCPYGKPGDVLTIRGTDHKIEITEVRVESVQDITEMDCQREGIKDKRAMNLYGQNVPTHRFKTSFMILWNSIYGDTDFKWENNPFCWVIKFRRAV